MASTFKSKMVAALMGAAVACLSGTSDADIARPCDLARPCRVLHSSYVAVTPPGWDGARPLMPAVWLHGYEQNATQVLANTALVDVFRRAGLLLIVPNGGQGHWAVPGVPNGGGTARDDVAFIASVLDDAARRYPLDRARATVLGFSLGASMVYTLACAEPRLFHRHVAFAGSFWTPLPKACAAGDLQLLHIHGTDDQVMPLSGRPIGPTASQGNVLAGLAFWRRAQTCGIPTPSASAIAAFTCQTSTCAGASAITYCSHPGGHDAEPAWVAWALRG